MTGTVWGGRDDTRGRKGGYEAGSANGLWEPERLWGWGGWDDSNPRGGGGVSPHTVKCELSTPGGFVLFLPPED